MSANVAAVDKTPTSPQPPKSSSTKQSTGQSPSTQLQEQQKKDESFSYANVVLNTKTTITAGNVVGDVETREDQNKRQTNDNNKENIEKECNQQSLLAVDESPMTNASTLNTTTNTDKEIKSIAVNDNSNIDTKTGDTDDDGSFTPVISHHHRKERKVVRIKDRYTRDGKLIGVAKQRRQDRIDGRPGGGHGNSGYEKRESRRSRDKRPDNRERELKSSTTSGGTVAATSSTTPGNQTLAVDGQTDNNGSKAISIVGGGSSGGSGGEDSVAASTEQDPIKFVEAPLPKVNAWKVSNLNYL